MSNRIPHDAFQRYIDMGASRSYQALADALGVSKRAVTKRAKRDGWRKRLLDLQTEARLGGEDRVVADLRAMNRRHLELAHAMQRHGVALLLGGDAGSRVEALRSIRHGVDLERRIICADPSVR